MQSQLEIDIEAAAIVRAMHLDRPTEHVTYTIDGKPVKHGVKS